MKGRDPFTNVEARPESNLNLRQLPADYASIRMAAMGLRSKWTKLTRYVSYLGPKSGLTVAALEGMTLDSKEISVSHRSLRRPVILRTRSSDIDAFIQVIGEQEYDVAEMPTPQTIIDA